MRFTNRGFVWTVWSVAQLFILVSARDGRVDSYLAAYMDSKYQDKNTQVVYGTPMEDSSSPNAEYGAPDNSQNEIDNSSDINTSGENKIPPSTSYGVPDLNQTYRIPETQPREPVTQRPLPHYGPPKYYYGPPVKPMYGPPPSYQYGLPMTETRMPMMLSHFQGLASQFLESPDNIKLVLATGLKVFLKVLVLKFIIKFFVMIALLLVIPKFDMGSMMMSDKNKSRTISDETLDALTKFVEDSYESLRTRGSIFPTCTEESEQRDSNVKLFCDLKRSAKSLNDQFSFSKLFPSFLVQYLEKLQILPKETT
ncbi:hypothetical protein M8J75_015744 [Diaphorina citri]|nr:hypothetical protein M8J75_015744 [Diaphorina citri]